MNKTLSRLWFCAASTLAVLSLIGCTSSMTPGKLDSVQAVSAPQQYARLGNVYLLRGWIGIFSHGIDSLTDKINAQGVRAHQYQDDQWSSLAETIAQKYKGVKDPEPLILVGHSYGADDVVRIARDLQKDHITVDLLITLDPVTPPAVTENVRVCWNLYQSNGVWDTMPWLRGVPLKLADDAKSTQLSNLNIRTEHTELLEPGTDHFNIEKKGKIHDAVIEKVLSSCPTRQQWAARGNKAAPPTAPITSAGSNAAAAPKAPGHTERLTDQQSARVNPDTH